MKLSEFLDKFVKSDCEITLHEGMCKFKGPRDLLAKDERFRDLEVLAVKAVNMDEYGIHLRVAKK